MEYCDHLAEPVNYTQNLVYDNTNRFSIIIFVRVLRDSRSLLQRQQHLLLTIMA